MRGVAAGLAALVVGCARPAVTVAPEPACPPPPAAGASHRAAMILLDGRRVAGWAGVVMTQTDPESYDFDGELPAPVRDLPPDKIDLIQFVSGETAERDYAACPGVVVALITTKRT